MGSVRIDDHVGRVLSGRYRLISALGTGASAHVYIADDVTLRRRVAVKVLHPDLANEPAFLRRFRAEAQAVASLRHPNIVAVHDWGEDGTPFLVCDLLEGGSLRSLLDTGFRLSPGQAAIVGLDAARGLDYAHRRGLVHRDVKPANLLFDDEGRLCVADFGVARALAEAGLTEPHGAVIGTARYASPEQVRGVHLDGRSDVYSLGLVLIEAVAGHVPFAADTTIGTLLARVDATVAVPESLGELVPVIRDACATDPSDRLDAGQLAGALEDVARDLPPPDPLPVLGPHARPAGRSVIDLRDRTAVPSASDAPYVEPPARARRRWPLLLALLVLLAAGGAGGAFALSRNRAPEVRVPTVVGLSQSDADGRLQTLHLKLRVAGEQNQDGTKKGDVLAQIPDSGSIRQGSTVAVVVSLGPPPVDIPDLTGMTQGEATAALTGAGLKPGLVTMQNSDTVPKGQLITWSPTGVPLPRGSTVDLVVSAGPQQIAVPDVVHTAKSFADAQAALTAAGFTVAPEVDQFSDTVPKGQIISTNPPAGTLATKGATVTVTVSKGQDLVTVPNLTLGNYSAAAAQAALRSAGLTPGFTYGPVTGTVFYTNPKPGTVVHRGATVDIYTQ